MTPCFLAESVLRIGADMKNEKLQSTDCSFLWVVMDSNHRS